MNAIGKVIIIGAGPGDPDLLTLKAVRHLGKADVILADRLVCADIMTQHAPQAVVIPVGKQCRKNKSTPQTTINELMVHHALAGRYVVRLKGGDTAVFSNMADELEALIAHNINYEIVPGVTAALGAAAYAGIPLTARGLSRGIRLLTYYNKEAVADSEWQSLATTEDTLVFYMSGETCFDLTAQLIAHGKKADTPILLAEQATTPLQILSMSTIGSCAQDWEQKKFLSPALIIIGEVAALHQIYGWKASVSQAEQYFPEVQQPVVTEALNRKTNRSFTEI